MTDAVATDAPTLADLKLQVTSVLGAGSGSTVMLVIDKNAMAGQYALKYVKREGPGDDFAIEAARAEAEASAKLDHPAILKVYDFRLKRSWFRVSRAELLMEYLDGQTLDKVSGLQVSHAIRAYQQVASALAHMHRKGISHGDVRPSKVMLSRTGKVKVRGYGLSLLREPYKSQVPSDGPYAPPERGRTKVADNRGDIYSLGASMYHTLTGRAPGSGTRGRLEGEKLSTPQALNREIPDALNTLVISCLQIGPERRPASMFEVSKALDGLVEGMSSKAKSLAGIVPGA